MQAVIKKWGNSYGIRLTRKELERCRLHEGDTVDVSIAPRHSKPDLSKFPMVKGDTGDVSANHDRYLYE